MRAVPRIADGIPGDIAAAVDEIIAMVVTGIPVAIIVVM